MTTKEIVQALRCCKFGEPCNRCPVVSNENCVNVMHKRAADLIERLTAENVALREKVPQWISVEDADRRAPAGQRVNCYGWRVCRRGLPHKRGFMEKI